MRDEETLASIVDIVPTITKACGLKTPSDLPGIDLLDRPAMIARKSIFVEGYTHDIAELGKPERSLVTQVVINGWSKLLLPGSNRPDKGFTSAPASTELFDLKTDPFEKQNLAKEHPEEVARLSKLQNNQWNATK